MRAFLVIGLLAMSLLAVPAQAESIPKSFHFTSDDGPAPGSSFNCLEHHGYILSDEPPAGDVKAYLSGTSNGLACGTFWTYTVTEEFTTMDGFTIATTFDCDAAAVYGSTPATSTSRFTLYHNGASIGEVTHGGGKFSTCTGSAFEDGAKVGNAGLTFRAGDTLQMRFMYWGSDATGEEVFLVNSPALDSLMTVPIQAPIVLDLDTAIFEDLEVPVVEHAFANATSDSYVFNFTAENGFGLIDLEVNGTGFANATLVDGNGTELFNGTLESGLTEYRNFTAGNWTLSIDYTEFTGNLSFEFKDGLLLANAEGPEEVEDVGSEAGNATEEDVTDAPADDQESPGAPMVALLAALAAIVVVRRRK